MSMTDPIADYLTRIRNGLSAKKRWIDVPSSKTKKRISLVLKEENYIDDFFFISDKNNKESIRVFLKYDYQDKPVIGNIKRVSRPGLRVYVGSGNIPRVLDGLGISILSTSMGVISNKTAQKLKVGGEILCEVF
jgi:small subunit ribosomal protein S8